jgi:hypothetical protein
MEISLSRRRLLGTCAVAATAGLAGCADPDVAMFVDRVSTDRAIAEQATLGPDHYERYASVVANATRNGSDLPQSGPEERPPFRPDRPVVHNGSVYDLMWESTPRTETHTEYVISLTAHDDDRETDTEFALLPDIDRERLDYFRSRLARRGPDEEQSLPQMEIQHRYTEAERSASALVPEPEYDVIAIEGYPVTVDVRSTTVSAEIYRYSATERASTLANFGSELRVEHSFELTGLSESEMEFFETVISDGSYYQGSLSDDEEAFTKLADRLVAQPALFVEDREGEWLVEYDSNTYWVTVDFVRMHEYADRLNEVDSL